jgi:peroxin-5
VDQLQVDRHSGPLEGLLVGPQHLIQQQQQPTHHHHWTHEFDQHQVIFQDHQAGFEKAFGKSVAGQPQYTNYQPYQQSVSIYPHVHRDINTGLLNSSIVPADSDASWAEGFKSAQERAADVTKNEINGETSQDTLSKTAGVIADIMDTSGNEKFKKSKFLGLMTDIRDKKVAVEGDKIVEQIQPASNSFDKAQEFIGEKIAISSWEEDFTMQQGPSEIPYAPPRNWKLDFIDDQLKSQYKPDVSHDMDSPQNLEKDSVIEKEMYENDWVSDFQDKMALESQSKNEEMWKQMEDTYDATYLDDQAYTRDFEYSFTQSNPYLSLSEEMLRSTQTHTNLTESILVSEALVQKGIANAQEWYSLGLKQQENENENAAIGALQKALQADPDFVPAYLSLAVSQTNENLTNEAYHSLTEWLNRNTKYGQIKCNPLKTISSSDYHEELIQHLLNAAMSTPGKTLDPEIQTALGILFNISSEYGKAVDCFQAALSVTPNDYQLWNKLGATLANSGESEKAMEAYFNALQINSSYIRARYNLAIACMQMGQHKVLRQ